MSTIRLHTAGMNTKTARRIFEIQPLGPYSLEESADFVGAWHHAPSGGGSAGGHLHLAFLTDEGWKPIGVCLTQSDSGVVSGEVYGTASLAEVERQVARILSLDVDGRDWPEVGRRDQVVERLQRRFPGFRPVNWSDAYEAAAWCVMSTRINMRQAQAVKDRMCRELGHEVDVHGHRLWAFPEPSRLIDLESYQGLFGRKVEYLKRLGRAALAGELDTETLRALPRHEALERLQRLAGIGNSDRSSCGCARSVQWTSCRRASRDCWGRSAPSTASTRSRIPRSSGRWRRNGGRTGCGWRYACGGR